MQLPITMLHHQDGTSQVMSDASCYDAQNVSSDQSVVFSRCFHANFPAAFECECVVAFGLYRATVCCSDGCPSGSFSHLHKRISARLTFTLPRSFCPEGTGFVSTLAGDTLSRGSVDPPQNNLRIKVFGIVDCVYCCMN